MKGRLITGVVSCAVIMLTVAGMATAAGITNAPDARFVKLVKGKTPAPAARGWLGIQLQDVTKDVAEAMDLKVRDGALVANVESDSPADKAGMEDGDVVTRFDGKKVHDASDLTGMVRGMKPGREVPVTVMRDGAEKKLTVKLGDLSERGEEFEVSEGGSGGDDEGNQVVIMRHKGGDDEPMMKVYRMGDARRAFLGVELGGLNEQLGEFFGVKDGKGALVNRVVEGSPAAEAGLMAGDVITKIGDDEVSEPSDVTQHMRGAEPGESVNITVVRDRGNSEQTVTAKLAKPKDDDESGMMDRDIEMKMPNVYMRHMRNMERMPGMQRRMERMRAAPAAPEDRELREQYQDLRDQMERLRQQLENMRDEMQKQREQQR